MVNRINKITHMNTPTVYKVVDNHHPSHSKNHRLVRAAYSAGLTNIVIEKYTPGRTFAEKKGWYLTCDQVKNLHLGFEVAESEKRIKLFNTPKY